MVVTDRLPDELRNRYAGTTKIKDVKVEVREDSDEQPAVFFVLTLTDPPAGQETWPIDDLWNLRRITREVVSDLVSKQEPDWEMPWFVSFQPETVEELFDDDELLDLPDD